MRKISAIILLLSFVTLTLASKPKQEMSADACGELFSSTRYLGETRPPSSSSLMPLWQLIKSRNCSHIPELWRRGKAADKNYTSAGTAQMYYQAREAVKEITDSLGIDPVFPPFEATNPWESAAWAIETMQSDNPPPYMGGVVIIREGIVMIAPALKLVKKKSATEKYNIYEPIVMKGHQDLRDSDLLNAAFLSWGLEPWQGKIHPRASVVLKPIVEKRKMHKGDEVEMPVYDLDVSGVIPRVETLYKDTFALVENATKDVAIAEKVPPRRCTECLTCPWNKFCHKKLGDDLSMIPNPPNREQVARLEELGIDSLEKLVELKINSPRFYEVSMRSEIQPERLKHFLGHAIASVKGEVLVMKPFEDPIHAETDYVIDVDFEDIHQKDAESGQRVHSGVYLFGVRISDPNKPFKKPISEFVWVKKEHLTGSGTLNQKAVDDAWARFLVMLKNHPKVKGKKTQITIYSKHEMSKTKQEFDIIEDEAENFSQSQKDSKFYSEIERGGKKMGRLIRNKNFFKAHPEVSPEDVFSFMDNSLDIYDIVRKNLATPGYSKGLKKLLPVANTPEGSVEYFKGANGQESLAWIKQWLQSLLDPVQNKIQIYNGKDIDGNAVMLAFGRRFKELPVDKRVEFSKEFMAHKSEFEGAVSAKRQVTLLRQKAELLEDIFGMPLGRLKVSQIEELKDLLARDEYLKKRKEVRDDPDLDEREEQASLQDLRFENWSKRVGAVFEFATRINPSLKVGDIESADRSLANLLSKGDSFLTANHIDSILLMEDLGAQMARLQVKAWNPSHTLEQTLTLPKAVLEKMPRPEDKPSDAVVKLWKGLYFERYFQ